MPQLLYDLELKDGTKIRLNKDGTITKIQCLQIHVEDLPIAQAHEIIEALAKKGNRK